MSIIERILKRIGYKFIGLIYLSKTIKLYRNYRNILFVVYSAGKTGSSTIFYTLLKYLPFNNIYHVHFLSDNWIKVRIPEEGKTNRDRNIVLANKVYKAINSRNWDKIYFITGARDPFRRSISEYFHNQDNKEIVKKTFEQLRNELQDYGTYISINWFHTDFCQYTNIDFESIIFDPVKGFVIINDKNVDYLIIRTDKISQNFIEAFKKITGFSIPELERVNERSNTTMANFYNTVIKQYFEDNDKIEEKINSEYSRKFFTNEELNGFSKKYSKKS